MGSYILGLRNAKTDFACLVSVVSVGAVSPLLAVVLFWIFFIHARLVSVGCWRSP